jgi:hypothetical protein
MATEGGEVLPSSALETGALVTSASALAQRTAASAQKVISAVIRIRQDL